MWQSSINESSYFHKNTLVCIFAFALICGNPLSTSQVISTLDACSNIGNIKGVAILYQRVKLFPRLNKKVNDLKKYCGNPLSTSQVISTLLTKVGKTIGLICGNPLSTSQVISTYDNKFTRTTATYLWQSSINESSYFHLPPLEALNLLG